MPRPLVWAALACAAGILVAAGARPHPLVPVALLALSLLGAVIAGRWHPRAVGVCLLVAVAAAGALQYARLRSAAPGEWEPWLGQRVEVLGLTTDVRLDPQAGRWRALVQARALRAAADNPPGAGEVPPTGAGGAGWAPLHGARLWVTYTGAAPALPAEGRLVRVYGTVALPPGPRAPGDFDLRAYLANRGVFAALRTYSPPPDMGPAPRRGLPGAAAAARTRLEAVLYAGLPPDRAALMAGLLFGSRSGIPQEWQEDFRTAGVFHILAVSGANVMMVAGPLMWLLAWCGLARPRAALVALPAIAVYCLVSGASPPVVRATLMTAVYLGGMVLGRPPDGFTSLAAAALAILLPLPGALFDSGFQLSFLATWGILALAGPLTEGLRRWLHPWLAAALAVTLAAAAAVTPQMLAGFGQLSLISPVANLVVAPVTLVLVPLGLVAVVAGLAAQALSLPALAAPLLGWCSLLTGALVQAMTWLAHVPGAAVAAGPLPPWAVAAWFGGLAAWRWRDATLAGARRWGAAALDRARRAMAAARAAAGTVAGAVREAPAAALLLAAALVAAAALPALLPAGAAPAGATPASARLEVHFIDVGQGDAILLRFPGGAHILVDGGDAPISGEQGVDYGQAVVLPYLRRHGVRRLDAVVISHPHQDHAGGLGAVVARLPVGEIWDPGPGQTPAPAYAELMAVAGERQVPVRPVQAGQVARPGAGALIQVLHPGPRRLVGSEDDANANSVVLRVIFGRTALLLTGDLGEAGEAALLARRAPLGAQVLKVPHHGSRSSSTPAFLGAVGPAICVITVGAGNPYGHPSPEVLQRLERGGCRILRTDHAGAVVLTSDGAGWEIRTSRRPPGQAAGRWFGAW